MKRILARLINDRRVSTPERNRGRIAIAEAAAAAAVVANGQEHHHRRGE